jgi:hypothetical protein
VVSFFKPEASFAILWLFTSSPICSACNELTIRTCLVDLSHSLTNYNTSLSCGMVHVFNPEAFFVIIFPYTSSIPVTLFEFHLQCVEPIIMCVLPVLGLLSPTYYLYHVICCLVKNDVILAEVIPCIHHAIFT